MVDTGKHRNHIDHLIDQGKTDEAVSGLFALIQFCVKHKDFSQAETLRERILDINPMALNEIVQAAELIESAKTDALDPNHIELWTALYATLTPAEQNQFFFAMKATTISPGDVVFEQGQRNTSLFLIDGGQAHLSYTHEGTQRLVHNLGPGDAAGVTSFFNASLCTATLTAISSLRLKQLAINHFTKWQQDDPSLAGKITDFFGTRSAAGKKLADSGHERRAHRRLRINGPCLFQVVNADGKPISQPNKGDLDDVSAGGLAFSINTSNDKQARQLLGRHLAVKFAIPTTPTPFETTQTGIITAVVRQPFSEYAVHVKFDRQLNADILDRITSIPESHRTAIRKGQKAL